MLSLREAVLREFGDAGAETLDRYHMQLDYTVFWCVRMLDPASRIVRVIPETVEDVVIERGDKYELRQVKTRAESVGEWSLDEVIPVLCAQYNRRRAFDKPCSFHFVSNAGAANHPPRSARRSAPLWILKHLSEKLAMDGALHGADHSEMRRMEGRIIPKIRHILEGHFGDRLDRAETLACVHRTRIETNSTELIRSVDVTELDAALHAHDPNATAYTPQQLRAIIDRILLLVIRKIRTGATVEARSIDASDVFGCTVPLAGPDSLPDLNLVAGRTVFEKKLVVGGFDSTEMPVFRRQKAMGETFARELEEIAGADAVERVVIALLELQRLTRRSLSQGVSSTGIGPTVYEALKAEVVAEATRFLPEGVRCDAAHCLGLLWSETGKCNAWWHRLAGSVEPAI